MELAQRRWVGRFVKLGLLAITILLVVNWLSRRAPRPSEIHVQSSAPIAAALGPGDAQIFTRDSAVNLILQGDKILAGLSPKTVAKIRAEIQQSGANDDTTALGGSIAKFVKQTVADNIGTHVVYPLAEIRDIAYEGDEIVIYDLHGNRKRMFGNVKMNKSEISKSFAREDAERFIEQVRARKQQLPQLPKRP